MVFGNWSEDLHTDIDQIKRIDTARGIDPSSFSVVSDGSAHFVGSSGSIYETTLTNCTCADFAMRGLPCKHIYALALASGLCQDLPTYSKKKAQALDVSSLLAVFHYHYLDGALTAKQYVKIVEVLTNPKKYK